MILQTWGDVLTNSFQEMWTGIVGFVPSLVVALIIFIAGWVIGAVLGRLVDQVVKALKVDNLLKSLGTEDLMSRAGFRLDAGAFLGGLVKWFVIVVFLIASVDVLGLTQVNVFLREVVLGYLPDVIVAAIILIIAAVVADAAQRVVVGSAKAADVPSAGFMGGITRWAIWIFAILAALSQLGIAGAFAQTLFTGLVAMLALAGGLAFGIGGKDAAARYIDKLRGDITHK